MAIQMTSTRNQHMVLVRQQAADAGLSKEQLANLARRIMRKIRELQLSPPPPAGGHLYAETNGASVGKRVLPGCRAAWRPAGA